MYENGQILKRVLNENSKVVDMWYATFGLRYRYIFSQDVYKSFSRYVCVCMYIHPRIGRYIQEDNYCKELGHMILEVW